MSFGRREIVLQAKVDYVFNNNVPDRTIRKGHYVGEREVSTEELESDLTAIIKDKLPVKMRELYGVDVKVNIKKIEYGSISVFFGAVFQGIQIIASYKSFIDSILLLREHAHDLITHLMKEKYGRDFSVNVDVKFPRIDKHDTIRDYVYHEKFDRDLLQLYTKQHNCKRDAFFWFLLVANIIMSVIIGAMSYGAITKTYFSQ